MTFFLRARALIREAAASSYSQPVASTISIVMVAGMCAAVLLTSGRTVGAEQSVLGSIDSAGTRSIVVRATPDAHLSSTVLDRLRPIEGIEWAGAFGAAEDSVNTSIPGSAPVPVRTVWGSDLSRMGIAKTTIPRVAWASSRALDYLGMASASGGVVSNSGSDLAIVGRARVPDYLSFLEPLVVTPQTPGQTSDVSVVVVIASSPELVAPLAKAVQSILSVDDPTQVKITTSENLAVLRELVQGQLGLFGRGLVAAIFALTSVLVAAILYGLVMLRRKDFGRRRALGASQQLIVGLLLTQMTILASLGAFLGSVVAATTLAFSNDPLPGGEYFAAVATLSILVSVAAALLPAIAAARRDPLKELRVP